jgi:membrane fusion protein
MPDDSSFFRSEVIEARRDRTGAPVANRGLAMWVLVAFMALVFAATGCFVALARYTKKETVLGQVVPPEGVARVSTTRPGIIKTAWAASGALVDKGQPLFTISYDNAMENGSFAVDGMVQANAEQIRLNESESIAHQSQLQQSLSSLRAKLASARRGLPLLLNQRALQAERVELLQRNFDAISSLADRQFMSQMQVSTRRDGVLQARQSLLQIDQNIESEKSQIEEVEAEIAAGLFAIEQARSNAQAARAQLEERRLSTLSSQAGQIAALASGNLTNVQVKPGDFVAANQTLALISPRSGGPEKQVILWVPSRSIGFVELGDKVRLMFDAFPYQTFGVGSGRVIEISTAPIMPEEVPIPIQTKEQMYKVTVDLDQSELEAYGRTWALRAGMRLTADLVLDEKSLLDWLLDPLAAVRKRSAA